MRIETNKFGDKMWFNNKGQFHNIIGPASIYQEGYMFWLRNNLRHNLDGPAVIYPDGDKAWWWLGKMCNEQQHSILSNIRFFTRRVKI